MKFTVYWKTKQSNGSTNIDAKDKTDAMKIIASRMPHANVYDAKACKE